MGLSILWYLVLEVMNFGIINLIYDLFVIRYSLFVIRYSLLRITFVTQNI